MVRQIVGIDAEELIPKFYGTGAVSGARYYEHIMKPREVVMRVALNPHYHINESVSDIRDELYRLISANRTGVLQLQFKSGSAYVAVINGFITKFEVGYFNQLPELQLTVTCPDPMFRSMHSIDYKIADLPSASPVTLADNSSTAPHGFSFRLKFTTNTAFFIISDHATTPDWSFGIVPSGGFLIDDELQFSSEYGRKQLYLFRDPDTIHLMDKVAAGSVWPLIFPGKNVLYFSPLGNTDWLELKYLSAYWGI
jgi:hypothetical protein